MRGILATSVLLGLGAAPLAAETFVLAPGTGSQVQFESRAPMETFSGRTDRVGGRIELDPAHLADSIVVVVDVDLASLDTGIELRNRHMRENHLETARYPSAVFRGGRVRDVAGAGSGGRTTFVVEGELDLHGVRRPLAAPVEMWVETEDGARLLRARTSFTVKLSDHGIARPKMLVLKLDEAQRVKVDLVARAAR